MQYHGKMRYVAHVCVFFSLFLCGIAFASGLEGISVISLGAVEGNAVLRFSDGRMVVVHIGDTIPGTKTTVRQVLSDRLVVEAPTDTLPVKLEKVWIYKSQAGGVSRIRKLMSPVPEESVQVIEVATPLEH